MLTPDQHTDQFLAVADQFKLGDLTTEAPHPLTLELSTQASHNLPAALASLKQVDLDALATLNQKLGPLTDLAHAVSNTLDAGHRIFLCGCGATGRLSLSLEIFARQGILGPPLDTSQIVGLMAGGDAALVRSIESFEDHPEWGARMLAELGFTHGDLLIATTEGGETPYVIGATEYAADHSSNPPFFLYCNPDAILARVAQRSATVLANPKIQKINLTVGPMAITGSTRMQASTVLMAAVGWAITHRGSPTQIHNSAATFSSLLGSTDLGHLARFTTFEADAYRRGDYVLYDPGDMGITVITDTTERSPTFSLTAFENHNRPSDPPSLSYLHLPGTPDSTTAWNTLLNRPPHTIEWPALAHLTGKNTALGFDFSDQLPHQRTIRTNNAHHHRFKIRTTQDTIRFTLGDRHHAFPTPGASTFHQHLLLKLLLNTHSTLIMGRLGRYRGNLMTYVSPTNHKLVDRAARYVSELLAQKAVTSIPYETIVRQIFHDRTDLLADEPIVLKTLNHFLPT